MSTAAAAPALGPSGSWPSITTAMSTATASKSEAWRSASGRSCWPTPTNIGLFLLAFRTLTARQVPTRDLREGGVAAGVGWQVVQLLGTYLVTHRAEGHARGLRRLRARPRPDQPWIYLLALVTVFAVEISVVAERRLWPRALLTPFTDRVRLTAADERAYTGYAGSEHHKGFEVIDVGFDPPPESTVKPRSEAR